MRGVFLGFFGLFVFMFAMTYMSYMAGGPINLVFLALMGAVLCLYGVYRK